MRSDIGHGRLDLGKLHRDLRADSRKFLLQTLAVGATLIIATATITTVVVNYVNHQAERDAMPRTQKF